MWVSGTLSLRYSKKRVFIVLYRDDGLSCFQNISGPESEKIKRKLCKIFKKHGLNIIVECNLRITDFLDVTLDLRTGKYYHTGKSAMNYYIFSSNQTTQHLSPSEFLPWLVKEHLILHVIKSALIKLPLTKITL